MHDPRSLIVRALLLDGAGQLLILGLILWVPPLIGWPIGGSSLRTGNWLLFSLVLYPFWLVVRQLYGVALAASHSAGAVTAACDHSGGERDGGCRPLLINPADSVWLVYRRVQSMWMLALTGGPCWCLALRRGLLPESPRLLLPAQ